MVDRLYSATRQHSTHEREIAHDPFRPSRGSRSARSDLRPPRPLSSVRSWSSSYDATGNRYDATAADAKLAAVRAQALHTEGKHAESEQVAKDALAKLGIKA